MALCLATLQVFTHFPWWPQNTHTKRNSWSWAAVDCNMALFVINNDRRVETEDRNEPFCTVVRLGDIVVIISRQMMQKCLVKLLNSCNCHISMITEATDRTGTYFFSLSQCIGLVNDISVFTLLNEQYKAGKHMAVGLNHSKHVNIRVHCRSDIPMSHVSWGGVWGLNASFHPNEHIFTEYIFNQRVGTNQGNHLVHSLAGKTELPEAKATLQVLLFYTRRWYKKWAERCQSNYSFGKLLLIKL